MTILKSEIIMRARTRHTCDECLTRISEGQSYKRVTFKDGGIHTWRSHIRCAQLSDVLNKAAAQYGQTYPLHDFSALDISDAIKELEKREAAQEEKARLMQTPITAEIQRDLEIKLNKNRE